MLNLLLSPGRRTKHPRPVARGFFLVFLVGWVCLLSSFAAVGANFSVLVDRDAITLGESFTLSLKFEGGEPSNVPVLPNIPNLAYNGPSRSEEQFFSIENGTTQSSSHITYSY